MNPALSWALHYAAGGLPVFPIAVGDKRPLTRHGLNDASVDSAQISAWWEAATNAGAELNVGLAVPDGYVVIDVDPRNSGNETYQAILQDPARGLPPTRCTRTGGGGLHLWFRVQPGLAFPKTIGLGIDLQGLGKYVVAPPSLHASGNRYEWVDAAAPIAEAPAWLLALGRPRAERKQTEGGVVFDDEASPGFTDKVAAAVQICAPHFAAPGVKHNFARALGGFLFNRGYLPNDAEALAYAVAEAGGSNNPEKRASDASNAWRYATPAGWSLLKEFMPESALAELEKAIPDLKAAERNEAARAAAAEALLSRPAPTFGTVPQQTEPAVTFGAAPPDVIRSEELLKLSKSLTGRKRSEHDQARGRALKAALHGAPLADDPTAATQLAVDLAVDIARQWPSATIDFSTMATALARSGIDPTSFQQKVLSEQAVSQAIRERKTMTTERRRAAGLVCDLEGNVKPIMTNVVRVLETDSLWAGLIGFDTLAMKPAIRHPERSPIELVNVVDAPAWRDVYTTRLRAWCTENYDFEPSKDSTESAVDDVAWRHPFHPVRDYLDSLTWDGRPRINWFWHTYFGAPNDVWHHCTASKFLIGCVARAYGTQNGDAQESAKLDTVPVLEGSQGMFKSRGIRALCQKEHWFTDSAINISNHQDAIQKLDGSWIVELADLSGIKQAKIEDLKAFLSSKTDSIRRSYARRAQKEARQWAGIATTNDSNYLSDSTGARRFWPVRCGTVLDKIDVAGIARDRDQLWAEAVYRFKHRPSDAGLSAGTDGPGERWWLDGAEHELAAVEVEQRYEEDPWEYHVEGYLARRPEKATDGIGVPELLDFLLDTGHGGTIAKQGHVEKCRVGRILIRLGWRQKGAERPRKYYK